MYKVPEAYKDYCKENESSFTEKVDITLPEELMKVLISSAEENKMSLNCYINYILLEKVILMISEREGFSFGMLYSDFQKYNEDEIFELIELHKKILIFDEHLEKKCVLLSTETYEKYKIIEESFKN